MRNRITDMLGIKYPILQAPMGWIARSQLASAVSQAGGLGIIETSSGELDIVKGEIAAMRTLTDKPFGLNLPIAFLKDPGLVDLLAEKGIRLVDYGAVPDYHGRLRERYIEEIDEECPRCVDEGRTPPGRLQIRLGRYGRFIGCSRYAAEEGGCKYIRNLNGEERPEPELLRLDLEQRLVVGRGARRAAAADRQL